MRCYPKTKRPYTWNNDLLEQTTVVLIIYEMNKPIKSNNEDY